MEEESNTIAPKKVHVVSKTKAVSSRLSQSDEKLSELFLELNQENIAAEPYGVKHLRKDALKLLKHTFEAITAKDDQRLAPNKIAEISNLLQKSN